MDWLSKAAIACGFKLDNLSKAPPTTAGVEEQLLKTPKLKGRARKLAKEAAAASGSKIKPASPAQPSTRQATKYSITNKDLIAQAEIVASAENPRITVPELVLRIVQRALDARKRCTAWFVKTGVKNNHSNEGHAHFIEVLETVIGILTPIASDSRQKSQEGNSNKPSQPATTQTSLEATPDALTNRFHGLEIQESQDDDEELPPLPPARKSKGAPKDASDEAFELDQEEHDFVFRAFCFFEDLERTRQFLKETWRRYKLSIIDLITATITTSAAMHLIEQEEARLFENKPQGAESGGQYGDIVSSIYYVEALQEGSCIDHYLASTDRLDITPLEEFIYSPTARTLYRFQQTRKATDKIGKDQWVQFVPPARMGYVARPELLKLPALERWQSEHDRLMKLLLDHDMHQCFFGRLGKQHDCDFLIEDVFARALRSMRERDELTVATVFTCRILLDIQDVLGDQLSMSFEELLRDASHATSELDVHTNEAGAFGPRQEETWLNKDMDVVLRLWRASDMPRKETIMTKMKKLALDGEPNTPMNITDLNLSTEQYQEIEKQLQAKYGDDFKLDNSHVLPEHRKTAESMDLSPLKHSNDGLFLIKQNPLYCGTLCFQMLLDLETSGIALANWHNSIFAIAHLYHASKHLGLLEGDWPELDSTIRIHQQTLFGGNLPSTPREMYSRLLIKMGATARNFARNPRARSSLARELSGKKIPPIQHNLFLDRFRSHYLGSESLQRSLYQLEYQIQEQWGFLEKKGRKNTEWTPIELTAAIEVQMPREVHEVENATYLSLTRRCIEALKAVRSELNRQFDDLYGHYPRSVNRDSNEPLHLVMVAVILNEASEIQEAKDTALKALREAIPKAAPQLAIAAEVLKRFVVEPLEEIVL